MTNTDVFSQAEQATIPTQEAQTQEEKNYIEELVGDGKKFKTVEDLAKGKIHSDQHINKLQEELASLREDLAKKQTAEEIFEKFKEMQQQGSATDTTHTSEAISEVKEQQPSTQLDIEDLVRKQLAIEAQTKSVETNKQIASQKLVETFGNEGAAIKLKETANRLNLTIERLQEIAGESPQALLSMVGANQQPQQAPTGIPSNTVNQTALMNNNSGEKNMAYFNKMRKEDPQKFNSPEIQMELFKLAKQHGDNFFN